MTDSADKYEEWIRKIKDASGVKDEVKEERLDKDQRENKENKASQERIESEEENKTAKRNWSKKSFIIPLLIFFIALVPRLYFIFFVNNPQNAGLGWYNDSYHHWQIAYLTQEIGLSHGFLRLWDLIGMEYFWGIL